MICIWDKPTEFWNNEVLKERKTAGGKSITI